MNYYYTYNLSKFMTPIELGIFPDNLLLFKDKLDKLLKEDNSDGIGPVKEFLCKIKSTKFSN